LRKFNKNNILILTKRKDLLTDLYESLIYNIKLLQFNNLFPSNKEINIINLFDKFSNIKNYNKDKNNIFIINIDKLIGYKNNTNNIDINQNLIKLLDINYNINFCIFDEIHWCGSVFAYHMMNYIKSKVNFIIGTSATPVRTMYENQQNAIKIFNKTKLNNTIYEAVDLEILEQLTYEECWENNLILPVEHHYLQISGIIKEERSDIGKKTYYTLTEEGYYEYLTQINNIWKKTIYGKSIFYFESRKSLLTFYKFLLYNKDKLNHLEIINNCINNIYMSFTISSNKEDCINCLDNKCINCFTANKINELELKPYNIINGIKQFKKNNNNSILFVIARAIEGFNDPKVEIVANIDYVMSRNILQTIQKIGRVQRIYCKNKQLGHFISPVPNNEKCKNALLQSIYDYINYVFTKNKYIKGDNGSNKQVGFNLKYIKLDESLNITHDDINSGLRKLEFEKGITYRKFIDLLKLNEVHNNTDYYKFKLDNPEINLCDNPFSFYSSKYGFCWADTYDVGTNPYYSCEKCIKRIKEIIEEFEENDIDIEDIEDIENELNEKDNKIPLKLYEFYNCDKKEFLIYN
jgi:superfamily II DNA or RNA helicase